MRNDKVLVNLTPHTLTLFESEDSTKPLLKIDPSGSICRVTEVVSTDNCVVWVAGHPITFGAKKFKKEVIGLPPEKDSVIYFTSATAAKVAWKAGRNDVVCPLKAHRGSDGRTDGTVGLSENPSLHHVWG